MTARKTATVDARVDARVAVRMTRQRLDEVAALVEAARDLVETRPCDDVDCGGCTVCSVVAALRPFASKVAQ